MQDPTALHNQAPGIAASEDCLYLDVWTPAKSSREKLPVIAWIYGGGFNGGMTSAPLYDGANFARKGVVFVSIAYRVGPFGFLATPELSRESHHGSGNYGLLDQIAGLKWIQKNIAAFGGDPSKVTVLGHSAGGFAVSMLAGSPAGQGLVSCRHLGKRRELHAAAGCALGRDQHSDAADVGDRWHGVARKSRRTDACRRTDPARRQHWRPHSGAQGAPRFWPPMDGYVISADQYQLWRQGRFNDTPILVGDVSDEAGGFGVRKTDPATFEQEVREGYGKHADAILSAYPHASDEQATRAATLLRSETTFIWGQYSWARLASSLGKHKAYAYWFDRPSAKESQRLRPRTGSRLRVRQSRCRRASGTYGGGSGSVRSDAELLGEFRNPGRPERRRPAAMAGIYRSPAAGDAVRHKSRAGAPACPGQAEGTGRLLRLAAQRLDSNEPVARAQAQRRPVTAS